MGLSGVKRRRGGKKSYQGHKNAKSKDYITISKAALTDMLRQNSKAQATKLFHEYIDATETEIVRMMMVLPTIVIMDSFGKLVPKKGRTKTFFDLVWEQYGYIRSGEVDLEELCHEVEDELGHEIEFVVER